MLRPQHYINEYLLSFSLSHLRRRLHPHRKNEKIQRKKKSNVCCLKGFFIMNMDLTGCPFYVLYHWTFNGNIFAIKYWKWMSAQTNYLKNRISRKHNMSTFFLLFFFTMDALQGWGQMMIFGGSSWIEFQIVRGEQQVKQICLIVFQCNWDDCICVLLLFLRINIY